MSLNIDSETAMMGFAYEPENALGAIKPPIYQSSTYVFKTAEEAKAFFAIKNGKAVPEESAKEQYIYSRLSHPNLEILENRLKLWDEAEDCAAFESGMAAISTLLLELVKPGEVIVHSAPLYSGADVFIYNYLNRLNIRAFPIEKGATAQEVKAKLEQEGHAAKVSLIYVETPANPTNSLTDFSICRELADILPNKPVIVADNTYLGPLWQQPLKHGVDLVIYSATKFIGGHSDSLGGAVLGGENLVHRIKKLRTLLGGTASPFTAWLLTRSLETMKLRMEKQAENAMVIAAWLQRQERISEVYYLGFLDEGSEQNAIFKKQCRGAGSMVSFDVAGGEAAAFKFLNALEHIKIAVSLGSTETLAQHPMTMTHSNVSEAHLAEGNITGSLIRMSVGIENPNDLIADLERALKSIEE